MLFTTTLAALVAGVAAKDSRTFAVLRHYGKGPLMEGRVDPIVNPNTVSGHVHTVMGGSNFGINSTGADLFKSSCTTALIKGDKSAYWFPKLYFQDPKDGHFEPVEMFYMNVYYFFEATNDQIKSFPIGLRMLSGSATIRDPPNKDGSQNLDPSKGPVNPLQWTCPRSSYDPPSWPVGSDGTKAGIQDGNNKGAGVGFPFANCDGYASPLRMDLHFPSCYNPAAGLENYKTNTAFPSDAGNGKKDCPPGWLHVPHLFYEVYWNTPKFQDRWTQNAGSQPFVLSNGDRTGYSGHGDFIAAWDQTVLQQIIDNCDAGSAGMDKCPGLIGGLNDRSTSCNINSPINEVIDGSLVALPGSNPVTGWGIGAPAPVPNPPASSSPATSPSTPAATSSTSSSTKTKPPTNTKVLDNTAASEKPAPTTATSQPPKVEKPIASPSTNSDSTTTVWKTVTEMKTKTVYADATPSSAAPTPSITPPTVTNGTESDLPDIAGFKYAGCYKDGRDRTLNGEVRPNLGPRGSVTNTKCITYCQKKGWKLAGTEHGGECYCGNELTGSQIIAESSCSMPCEGDQKEICGGDWSLSVYSADGSATVSPKVKRHLHNHAHHHNHRRGASAFRR